MLKTWRHFTFWRLMLLFGCILISRSVFVTECTVFARRIACGFLVGMLPRTPLIIFISQDFIKTKVSKNLSGIRNERCNQLTLPKFNSSPLKSYQNPMGKVFQPPFLMGYVKLGYGFSNTDIDETSVSFSFVSSSCSERHCSTLLKERKRRGSQSLVENQFLETL